MAHALDLAELGRLSVSPNPMVGACLVKSGKIVGEGFHQVYGESHAEVHAFEQAGKKTKGSTLYVTLEPCSSFGNTPPCLDLILKSEVKRVVIGLIDPNPKHQGKAVQVLKKSGIQVTMGVLSKQIASQNEAFLKWIKTGKPFVTLKMAQTMDGKIATKTGESKWISGKVARGFVQELRAEQDAILVGKNTFFKDNPSLTVRGTKKRVQKEKPWRVVFASELNCRAGATIIKGPQQTIFVISEKKLSNLKSPKSGATYIAVPEKKGKLDLKDLMKQLGGLGISKLLVEGGGELAASLIEQKLVDKFYWIVAPKIFGGRDAVTSVEGDGVIVPSKGQLVKIEHVHQLGEDIMFEGRLKY